MENSIDEIALNKGVVRVKEELMYIHDTISNIYDTIGATDDILSQLLMELSGVKVSKNLNNPGITGLIKKLGIRSLQDKN